jgi:hypothetical protein
MMSTEPPESPGGQGRRKIMDFSDAAATLACHLPAGTQVPGIERLNNARAVAEFQLQHLTEAGYAIVPVSGEALEAVRITREADRAEALRRADQRLAEARRNGPDDSWWEGDQ